MEPMFSALLELLKTPLLIDRGVKTDRSVLLVYPPKRELDFREYLLDTFLPELDAKGVPYRVVDLSGFMFSGLNEELIDALQEEEFEDCRWMKQGLSKRLEATLQQRLRDEAEQFPGTNIIVYATVALYPLVRYGELLRELRDVEARIVLGFPGEERGGKLHFMNQDDGANYLAIKLFAH